MMIACPACDARYEVPDAVVAGLRPVRCARCGEDWVPGAPEAAAAPPIVIEPEPAPEAPEPVLAPAEAPVAVQPVVPPPELRVRTVPPRQPRLAWAASILVLAGLGAAGMTYRAPVMRAWPPSTRLYLVLGLYSKEK